MLFLSVYKYEPGQRNEILKRRMEKGMALSEGMKVIGEWSDLGGGRGFLLFESNDPMACTESTRVWSDLIKMEIIPVIETAEMWKGYKG